MEKKILVLTASPRQGGNSDALADAFIRGAKQSGHQTHKRETAFMTLGGCRACDTCWSTGTACSRKDDFQKLEPLFESCDVLVISTPLYWFAFPAQIKGAIDRLYAYGGAGGDRPLAIKETALLVCGEGADDGEYEPIRQMYELAAGFMKWKDRGVIVADHVGKPGDVQKTKFYAQAEALGKEI